MSFLGGMLVGIFSSMHAVPMVQVSDHLRTLLVSPDCCGRCWLRRIDAVWPRPPPPSLFFIIYYRCNHCNNEANISAIYFPGWPHANYITVIQPALCYAVRVF